VIQSLEVDVGVGIISGSSSDISLLLCLAGGRVSRNARHGKISRKSREAGMASVTEYPISGVVVLVYKQASFA
jgi:hypothetical protein